MAREKDRLRAAIRALVEARCLALASAHTRKNGHDVGEFDCVYHGCDLLGQLWRLTPEEHAARWSAGSGDGHLDAYFFSYENDDGLVTWLARYRHHWPHWGGAFTVSYCLPERIGRAGADLYPPER
ncbi:hypothetical protein PQR02_37625 [Paraburkholderia sediminicola]|uniref:Uncharacterized protein n=1 Tax=Paraburkholderia rhynchosiae TaxID=487049 RepID=A0ACC7NRS5_9BURK